MGAEADSPLALHKKGKVDSQLTISGFDIEPAAIKAARLGKYLLPLRIYKGRELKLIEEGLEEYGFVVSPQTVRQGFGAWGGPCRQAYSSQLRDGENLRFTQSDISKDVPLNGKADLVLANNILYHLDPKQANLVIKNLACVLSERGVLSIGNTHSVARRMGVSPRLKQTRYGDWLKGIVKPLEKEFGLQPVVFAKLQPELPAMFART